MLKSLKPTTSKHGVPMLFHEPHVETGFRLTHQPWSYYLCSLFQKHNECMNCWTHLVGLLLTIGRVISFSQEYHLLGDRHMWPLSAGLITMILMYLCSTFAHCFSNRSEVVHYTAFMIDYAGIGLFGLGSVILHHAYCHDESLHNTFIQTYAVSPFGIIMGTGVCFCCSISKAIYKRPYPFARKVWQLSSVTTIYLWLLFPILYRWFLYLEQGKWDPSLHHHLQQTSWFITAGFFFSSEIPQRFCPGMFDFVGHSHQIFHICIIMVTLKQLDGIALDLVRLKPSFPTMTLPTFWNTFGAVFLVIVLNCCIISGFLVYVKNKMNQEKAVAENKSQ